MVTVSDNKGTTKEVEMDILTDFYTDQKHIDIVDGESTVNMTKLSDLMSAYNYLRFVDLKADDKGNVTLNPVDLRDTTLQAINENAREIYFCYENSDGYYAFVKDGDVYVYEGYRQEDGFRDTYLFYGVSIYPWTYEFVRNPYLEAGSEVYEPIPLSEDILSGYAYRMPDGRMLTYHGVEGMYLDEYNLTEDHTYMTFKDVEDDSSIEMQTRETSYFDQLYTGERTGDYAPNLTLLDGIMIGTDFIVSYDPAQERKDIVVHLEKDDIDFCFGFEADNLENSYESEILKARVMLDSLTVSSGEQTVDEYLQDTIEIGDYKFSDAVQFDHIKRGKESAYGLSFLTCKDMDFRFEMEREANEVLQFDIFNMEQVYETGFGDSFEVYLEQSPTTHEYMDLYVHVPNKPNEILCVTAPDFFEYGMEFSEVEEQSKDYLLNNLLRNILVLRE